MVPVVTELTSSTRRDEALRTALSDNRERLRLRVLAAGVRSEDTEDLVLDAITSIKRDAWLGSNLSRILVQAVDSACEQYAHARSIPYRLLLHFIQRRLPAIETLLAGVGLTPYEREEILRSLVRSTPKNLCSDAEKSDDLLLDWVLSNLRKAFGAPRPRVPSSLISNA